VIASRDSMRVILGATILASAATGALGYAPQASRVVTHSRVAAATKPAVHMDETLFDDILSDKLEQEGAASPWLSEAGWAVYLDKEGIPYAMNDRVSDDFNYFSATVFGNPFDVLGDFFENLGNLGLMFRTKAPEFTLKGSGAKEAAPKKADPSLREVGKPGVFNLFGAGPTEIP